MPPDVDAPPGDLWVFGYGSLMWNPGFPVMEAQAARLAGWHRAFCMSSIHYRGTVDYPGLVLGLAPGGSCVGRAFRVAAADRLTVIAYLRARELISYVYREITAPVRLITGPRVTALTYVADRSNAQYVGGLDFEAQAIRMARAAGRSGPNADYLRRTVIEMDRLGLPTGHFHDLLARVEAIRAQPQRE